MKLYIAFALFLIFFLSVNIAFLDNLRKVWGVSYPLVLLAINLDLLVLMLVFVLFFRKFLKTYLAGRRAPLRRKLSTSLMLYIITPLLFLNLVTAIILLQATKSYVSGQLKEVAKRSEALLLLLEESSERLSEKSSEARVKELAQDMHRTAVELRNMVKARDIIGGIYVYFLVLAGFASFLSAVWFGNLIARHITLPLEKLTQKSKEIARGNFEVSVEVPQSGDEVQELALSFLKMKEELKDLYGRLQQEKETLLELLNALPVGIVFFSKEGETFKNRAYEELSKKSSVRESSMELALGRLLIYEDLESVILAERFKTWQMAVKRIAHEIKNPLTPISLNLERLIRLLDRGECKPESLLPVVKLVLEELYRVKKVVDQFRSLSTEV
ncbi:MAG: HAMP domain-containing protein, partial [Aquificaceae bacterium]|nr:HAMP domain-containing protein [Aquificaceae bacterium]